MKYFGTILVLFSSFLSLSTCASINAGDLCLNMQRYIADYLENPGFTLGSVNRHSRHNLTVNYPLKYFVNQRFNIPELAKVNENEPELQNILTLSSFVAYPDLFLMALVEDVIKGKKRYHILYGPLILYLTRKFKDFSERERENYFGNEFSNFENLLMQHYRSNGDYKSAFETIQNNPTEISTWFLEEYRNSKTFEMFNAFRWAH